MVRTLRGASRSGLERSCGAQRPDWLRSRELPDGVVVLQAWFAGHGFDRHRHDTYAIGVTDAGVQAFDYRGATPERIGEAARAIRGRSCALPFVRQPVAANAALAGAIEAAFRCGGEPLAIDGVVVRLAEALLAADPSLGGDAAPIRIDAATLARAREFLDTETARVIRSSELEEITGLTRYDLARQFRASLGTSPYRYSLMRRLDRARAELRRAPSLADVALATGFADQAHFTRMFRAAFGVTPARYRALEALPAP